MRSCRFVTLLTGFAIATTAALAQDRSDPAALRSSIAEMLPFLSFGAISVPDQAAPVTQSGPDVHLQLPLNGFAAPPDAAAELVAHPAMNGAWDVTSLTFPQAGALGTSIDQVVSYTVGQQTVRGRLHPNLATPSTLVANLSAITLHSVSGGRDTEQSIEHLTTEGTLSGTSDGRVNLRARNAVTNWHAVARELGDLDSDSLVRHMEGHLSLSGLNRAQGSRLITAVRSFFGTAKTSSRQPDPSRAQRSGLREILDAATGLLTGIEADETLNGTKFDFDNGNAGTLGRMQLHVKGEADDQRLNAALDVAIDELSFAAVSPDQASLLPHHVTARSVVSGIQTGQLLAWLRAATATGADPTMLQRQATAMLAAPGAQAALESVAFDAGPLHVRGSARLVPRPDGEAGADIHVAATGVDALVAQVQSRPGVQGALPMVLLAKIMGRAEGNSIVWDIALGGGPITVNGLPVSQPPARTR